MGIDRGGGGDGGALVLAVVIMLEVVLLVVIMVVVVVVVAAVVAVMVLMPVVMVVTLPAPTEPSAAPASLVSLCKSEGTCESKWKCKCNANPVLANAQNRR